MRTLIAIHWLLLASVVGAQPLTVSELAWPHLATVATNYPPQAQNSNYVMQQDAVLTNSVYGSDTDSVSGVWFTYFPSSPTNGTVALNTNTGAFTYSPGIGYTGSDLWKFLVHETDGSLTATGLISINILASNYPPQADDAAFVIQQNDVLNNYVHGYDTDSVAGVWYSYFPTPSTNGTALLTTNTGAFAYTPTLNFTGNDYWKFLVSENDGSLTSTGLVSVAILPTNSNSSAVCIAVKTNVLLTVIPYGYATNIVTQYTNGTKIVAAINSPQTGYNQTYCVYDVLGSFHQCFFHQDGDPLLQYTPTVTWATNFSLPAGDTLCFGITNADPCLGITQNITNVTYTTYKIGGTVLPTVATNYENIGSLNTGQSNGLAGATFDICNRSGYSSVTAKGNFIWRYNTGVGSAVNGAVWINYSINGGPTNNYLTLSQTNYISTGYDFFNTNTVTINIPLTANINTAVNIQMVVSNFIPFHGGQFDLIVTNTLSP